MESLTIEKTNAIKAYQSTDAAGKTLLGNLFGTEVFSQKMTDRVKSFEDAAAVIGIPVSAILSKYDEPDEAAYKQIKVIATALNEGWKPDWSNTNQLKYYPYFKYTGSGFAFYDYAFGRTYSGVGSRLVFKSRELAEYAGKQFIGIYNQFLSL